MNNQFEEYLELVDRVVKKYSDTTKLIHEGAVSPEDLNRALAQYLEVSIVLIGEYEQANVEFTVVKNKYQEWFDEKFVETKNRMNEGLTGSKKLAVKEYETELRVTFKKEYREWQDKLVVLELKVGFFRRLNESYKQYDRILTALSGNMKQEMVSLSLGNRMNTSEKGVSDNKIRRSRRN